MEPAVTIWGALGRDRLYIHEVDELLGWLDLRTSDTRITSAELLDVTRAAAVLAGCEPIPDVEIPEIEPPSPGDGDRHRVGGLIVARIFFRVPTPWPVS
jgi:hypothetical protein